MAAAVLSPSWPGVSRPSTPHRRSADGRDTPGHDDRETTLLQRDDPAPSAPLVLTPWGQVWPRPGRGTAAPYPATSATCSAVKPKYFISAPPGADSPKRSMPTPAPSRPTYLSQLVPGHRTARLDRHAADTRRQHRVAPGSVLAVEHRGGGH